MLSEELFKNVIYFILTETCMEKLAEVRDQLKVSQCPEQLDDPKGWTIPSTYIYTLLCSDTLDCAVF